MLCPVLCHLRIELPDSCAALRLILDSGVSGALTVRSLLTR